MQKVRPKITLAQNFSYSVVTDFTTSIGQPTLRNCQRTVAPDHLVRKLRVFACDERPHKSMGREDQESSQDNANDGMKEQDLVQLDFGQDFLEKGGKSLQVVAVKRLACRVHHGPVVFICP